jgi:4a-hydroxytetrahydrobiopterin dehydratase
MNDLQILTPAQINETDLSDWRQLLVSLHTRFATGSFMAGLELAHAIGLAAEVANHHPDLSVSYPYLDVQLTSHDAGGVTQRDVNLAREISRIAAATGVAAQPANVCVVEIGLDTADQVAIKPFWQALLASSDSLGDDEINDPSGQLPTIWFQATEPHETPRQRLHLDVHVPYDVAQTRVAAALAAGGRLISDADAPAFWVLADAAGNKACVCTCGS